MKKISSQGFSAVEALLVLVIIGILAGTGIFVYKAQNSASKTLDTADKTAASQTKVVNSNVNAEYIQVLQESNGTVNKVDKRLIKDFATNAVELEVLEGLAKNCEANTVVTVSSSFFDDSQQFKLVDSHASTNTSCQIVTTNIDDIGGSGARQYLHKTDAGWIVDGQTQMGMPSCSYVDSKGYPSEIVSECYSEDGSLRAVKS